MCASKQNCAALASSKGRCPGAVSSGSVLIDASHESPLHFRTDRHLPCQIIGLIKVHKLPHDERKFALVSSGTCGFDLDVQV
jgi:hypothetical protein